MASGSGNYAGRSSTASSNSRKKARCSRKTIINLEAGENVAMYIAFRVITALGMALEVVDRRIDLKSLAELVEHDE